MYPPDWVVKTGNLTNTTQIILTNPNSKLIEICKDVLGAVSPKGHGSFRKLLFDKRKLYRTDIGLDRHLNKGSDAVENIMCDKEMQENYKLENDIVPDITLEKDT